jgi:hypothetical protein
MGLLRFVGFCCGLFVFVRVEFVCEMLPPRWFVMCLMHADDGFGLCENECG